MFLAKSCDLAKNVQIRLTADLYYISGQNLPKTVLNEFARQSGFLPLLLQGKSAFYADLQITETPSKISKTADFGAVFWLCSKIRGFGVLEGVSVMSQNPSNPRFGGFLTVLAKSNFVGFVQKHSTP